MKLYTLAELFRMTRNELLHLHTRIITDANRLPENAPERAVAVTNLRRIRTAIYHRWPVPS